MSTIIKIDFIQFQSKQPPSVCDSLTIARCGARVCASVLHLGYSELSVYALHCLSVYINHMLATKDAYRIQCALLACYNIIGSVFDRSLVNSYVSANAMFYLRK